MSLKRHLGCHLSHERDVQPSQLFAPRGSISGETASIGASSAS